MAPQKEITEGRPTNYSRWHRYPNLPRACYLVDGDWFEMRKRDGQLVPIACFETFEVGPLFIHDAQRAYRLWDAKVALYTYLRQNIGIPVFIVRHTPDCKLFSLSQLTTSGEESEAIVLDDQQYKKFLLSLGDTL